jgi:hypothetical protein
MLFEDARHNDLRVIKNKVTLAYHHSATNMISYDFSDEAYEKAQEIFAALKPMTAIGYKKIRLGSPQHDGGYIFLDAFDQGEAKFAYSFGISTYDPFSLDMVKRGYEVWQYDGTIGRPPYDHPQIHFKKFNISGSENPQPNERNLRQIIDENGHRKAKDIILQCDIEGSEWAMLKTARTEDLLKFSQINLEIHASLPQFSGEWRQCLGLLKKLNETHQVIHIHANNYVFGKVLKNFRILPAVFEVSYVRRDFCQFTECMEEFPTGLDFPCDPNMPDIFIGSFDPAQKATAQENLFSGTLAEIFAQRDKATTQRDEVIAQRDAAIIQRDTITSQLDMVIAQRDKAVAQRDEAIIQLDAVIAQRDEAVAQRDAVLASRSWFFTRPLRGIARVLRGDCSLLASLKHELKAILKPPLLALIHLVRSHEIVNNMALNCLRWTPRLKERLHRLNAGKAYSLNATFSDHPLSPREKQFYARLKSACETERRKRNQ